MVRVRIRVRFGVRVRLGHSCVLARCASGLDPSYLLTSTIITAINSNNDNNIVICNANKTKQTLGVRAIDLDYYH